MVSASRTAISDVVMIMRHSCIWERRARCVRQMGRRDCDLQRGESRKIDLGSISLKMKWGVVSDWERRPAIIETKE